MRTTLSPTLDIIFKLLFEARENREALISLLTAVLRPARPIAEVRVLNPGIRGERVDDKSIVLDILVLLDDEEVKEACMSNPAIAKANEVLSSLSDTPRGKEFARRRQLALDGFRIQMGGAKAEGLAEGLAKGRAEARVELLRTTIIVLADALGIELDQARRDEIAQASLAELEARWARLAKEHHW